MSWQIGSKFSRNGATQTSKTTKNIRLVISTDYRSEDFCGFGHTILDFNNKMFEQTDVQIF